MITHLPASKSSPSPGWRWRFVGIVGLVVLSLALALAGPTEAQLFGKKKNQDQQRGKPYEPTPKIEKNLERGYELMEAGELDKAQHRFEKALDLSVLEEPRAFLALAELNLRRERWEAAAKVAGRTLDVSDDPQTLAHANYLRGLGLLRWYQELERDESGPPPSTAILQRAAESLRYVIQNDGEHALDAHLRLATVYELGGQPEEARKFLATYLERQDAADVPAEVRDLQRRLESVERP